MKSANTKNDGHELQKRKALGKGLESLLKSSRPVAGAEERAAVAGAQGGSAAALAAAPAQAAMPDPGGKPRELRIELIDKNPYQTRMRMDEEKLDELARSIAANGVVQPIIVRPLTNGRFQLIAGERRWRASERAGKETVPAIVRQVSDEQAMEMTIVENLQRADLNPMEQARAYERLGRDFNMTQEQMALRTGKDRATVGNFLRMLRLPPPVQNKVEAGELSFGHARALLALGSAESIVKVATKVAALSMSVRQTETYIQNYLNAQMAEAKGETKPKTPIDPNVREAQEALQRKMGLKVRIEDKRGRGKVIIEYAGLEDFDSILAALGVSS